MLARSTACRTTRQRIGDPGTVLAEILSTTVARRLTFTPMLDNWSKRGMAVRAVAQKRFLLL